MSQNPDTLLTQKSLLIPNIILAFDPRNSFLTAFQRRYIPQDSPALSGRANAHVLLAPRHENPKICRKQAPEGRQQMALMEYLE